MAHIIEIGSLREPVELLDVPRGGRRPRSGRIKHANGENAEVDFATLHWLLQRAEAARKAAASEDQAANSSYAENSPGIMTCGWLLA